MLNDGIVKKIARAFNNLHSAFQTIAQDPTNAQVNVCMNLVNGTTTLSAQANINDRVISVTSASGIAAGTYIGLFNLATNRFYAGFVVSITAEDLTMDKPIDSVFEIGDLVGHGTDEMSVNGLTTPVTFGLRGADPGLALALDITKMKITCITDGAVDLSLFGDIAKLLNGITLRQVNGVTNNILNIKSNQEISGLMEWIPYAATNPAQGIDGFVAEMDFRDGNGSVIRVETGEDIEAIIADNLLGITSLRIVLQGHLVEE